MCTAASLAAAGAELLPTRPVQPDARHHVRRTDGTCSGNRTHVRTFASPVLALINEQSRDSLEQMFEKARRLAYVGNQRTTTSAVDQQGLTFSGRGVPGTAAPQSGWNERHLRTWQHQPPKAKLPSAASGPGSPRGSPSARRRSWKPSSVRSMTTATLPPCGRLATPLGWPACPA